MSKRKLPEAAMPKFRVPLAFEANDAAMLKWNGALRSTRAQSGTVIDIYDVIGVDWWTGEGFTAKKLSTALKGAGDITVNLNSPGGDMFEGITIYNLLRAHAGGVDVNIMGMAASAASIVAMAGDSIRIGKAASLMIHKAWGIVVGNEDDFLKAAEDFAQFDAQMAGIYVDRTGLAKADIVAMMKTETWLSGEAAVAQKFADALLPADEVKEDAAAAAALQPINAIRDTERRLMASGLSRADARKQIKLLKSDTPGAVRQKPEVMQDADLNPLRCAIARLQSLIPK